jgi:iron complex outermembrane receptor protein
MTQVTNKREQGTTLNSVALRLTPIAAGCAIMLSTASGSVFAQDAVVAKDAEQKVDTIVVTGIRRGIEAAISIKKNSSSIVEAISAEDIGKLPDTSVAASIARLPGVTAQRSRDNGRASGVSVRGLAPSFNGSLLNGREQASTGNARSPEFDLFPAELLGSVLIYKTPDAALVAQGLAATIDLHTLQPLDFGKRVLAANYRKETTGVKSGSPEGKGDRETFTYVDQFADRTIGVSLGLVKYKNNGGGQQKFDSWGGWAADVGYNGGTVKTPGGFKADTETTTDSRDGVSASLQFKPNKMVKSTLDVFYSAGKSTLKRTGLEGAIAFGAGGYDPNGVLSNATIANGVATSGTLSNYKGVVRNHIEAAEDKLTSIGWNTSVKLGDWTGVADVAHSKGTKNLSRFETTAGQPGDTPAAQLGSISWTGFNGTNFKDVKYSTSLNYADRAVARLTDVNGWGGGPSSPQAGYVALPNIDDKVDSLKLSAQRELSFGPISGVDFGINLTKREKARTGEEGRLVVKGGGGYASAAVPGSAISTAGPTGLSVASFDPRGSLGTIYDLAKWVDASTLAKDWSVSEKVNTAYAKADLEGDLFGLSYKGNFGSQFVHTDQQSTGNKVDLATCTGITPATCPSSVLHAGTTYSNVLPSMNLSFDLGSEQVIRWGAAKVISRANLDDMRASNGFGVATNGQFPYLSGSGGNPYLKPFKATALDLSYEKYFGNKGYVSLAGFYKTLDTYILRAPQAFDFKDQISANTPLPKTGPFAGSTVGLLTQPTNGDGGNIHGFEIAVNIPFSMVSKHLDGFGMLVNHSDTTSGIKLPVVGFSTQNVAALQIPLPGLSKRVSNLRLYYEKNGFQVAWAAKRRSDFLGQVSDFQDNAQLTFIKGDTIVDIQASYEFQSGWFKGLTLLAQANDWTHAPYNEYNTDRKNPVFTVTPGRTYLFGLNYKY